MRKNFPEASQQGQPWGHPLDSISSGEMEAGGDDEEEEEDFFSYFANFDLY